MFPTIPHANYRILISNHHITTILKQLSNRMDAVDEHRAREGVRSPNRRGRSQLREESLEGNHRIDGENLETEFGRDFEPHHHRVQHHRDDFPRNRDRQGLENQPIHELTKRMKVDVPDFYSKLELYAFKDWLTAII